MASELADRQCVPCTGAVSPLSASAIATLRDELGGSWDLEAEQRLSKAFSFDDFLSALGFVNAIGAIAEEQGHHPDVYLAWGMVRLTIWTHAAGGLTESDFVLAAKADRAYEGRGAT